MYGAIFATIISLVFPIGMFMYYIFHKRYFLSFILGILTFVISQILLRIPLIEWLGKNSISYNMLSTTQPVLFVLLIGFSAGIFEEVARYMAMRFLMNRHRSWQDGVVFGVGHGGIEAFLFLGINAAIVLFSPTITLVHSDNYFIGGIERMFAMLLHIGLSIIVLKGVNSGRLKYLGYAIFLHGLVDSFVGLVPMIVPRPTTNMIVEGLLILTSILIFIYCIRLKRNWSVVK